MDAIGYVEELRSERDFHWLTIGFPSHLAPFIIPKTYHPDEEQYIAGGAILAVSDYTDLMPNYTDQVKRWNLGGDIDTLRQDDGKYYLLPGLHESTTPKLLVWGEDDQFQTVDYAERFVAEIPATRLVRIPAAGHIPMENDPRAVFERLFGNSESTRAEPSSRPAPW